MTMLLERASPATLNLELSDANKQHEFEERQRARNATCVKCQGTHLLPTLRKRYIVVCQDCGEDQLLLSVGGGAASTWAMTNTGRTSLLNGTFDIDTDSWKMALFLSTSNIGAASTTYAGLTNEHANANGYTTGGIAVALTLAGTTTVTVDITTDPVWTASGGSIVARFGVIYEVSGNVLCYSTLDTAPADVTATTGNTLTVAAHASGVLTLA
jgi:hypothetical protein